MIIEKLAFMVYLSLSSFSGMKQNHYLALFHTSQTLQRTYRLENTSKPPEGP